MPDKLKSCPFCGSEDIHTKFIDRVMAAVECNYCGARGPVIYLELSATDAWNRRANNE